MDKFNSIKFGGENKPSDLKNKFSEVLNKSNLKEKLKLNPAKLQENMAKLSKSGNFNKVSKVLIPVFGVLLVLTVLLFFIVINPILSLRDSAMKLQKTVNQTSYSLINDRDLVAYEANLAKLEGELNALKVERDSKIGHLKNFPYIKDFYGDFDIFINTGLKLVAAGKEVRPVIEPFADAMGIKVSKDQQVNKVGFAEAVAAWISVMPKVAQNLDPIILKLDEAGKELNKIDAQKYNINILGIYKNDLRPELFLLKNL